MLDEPLQRAPVAPSSTVLESFHYFVNCSSFWVESGEKRGGQISGDDVIGEERSINVLLALF